MGLTHCHISGLIHYYTCSLGHSLESARLEAQSQLMGYLTRNSNPDRGLSRADKFELDILSERLATYGVLRPLGYFNVNHETHLSGFNTMLTYIVVLMQFKVSGTTG